MVQQNQARTAAFSDGRRDLQNRQPHHPPLARKLGVTTRVPHRLPPHRHTPLRTMFPPRPFAAPTSVASLALHWIVSVDSAGSTALQSGVVRQKITMADPRLPHPPIYQHPKLPQHNLLWIQAPWNRPLSNPRWLVHLPMPQ